jgi:hypothetical protein
LTESDSATTQDLSTAPLRFYSGALDRIRRFMVGIATAGVLATLLMVGWQVAMGVLAGSLVSYVNFHWLKQVVSALGERAASAAMAAEDSSPSVPRPSGSGGIVARFLLRYLLIALASYAIFTRYPGMLYGFLGGLFLAVAAIAAEAGCELYAALRRGF